jgi:hypothetical protein
MKTPPALDDLPYALTGFAHERGREYFHGQETEVSRVVAYPQVIRRVDQVAYAMAIEPALTLLTDMAFTAANREFL